MLPQEPPPDVVKKLNAEINKILARPEIQKKAEDSGTFVEQMTPAQLATFTKKEFDFWGKVIENASITAE
jgi:tripartite-type tricarboxylate transporter receptor subunit TctC